MRRISLASVVLTMALIFGFCSVSEAAYLHYLNCNECHKVGTTIATLTGDNTCLQCHGDTSPASIQFNDSLMHITPGRFALTDASNFAGSYPGGVTPGQQTSHYWASTKDTMPIASAQAPTDPLFYSRYNTSTGRITCSRCHNPHADVLTKGKKSLRIYDPNDPLDAAKTVEELSNEMCLDCHRGWNDSGTHGLGTHPINMDYATAIAKPENVGEYNDIPTVLASTGNITLVGGKVGCTSCHGVHAVDSDASTPDGFTGAPGVGDGLMLKHNGPAKEDVTDSICMACHKQSEHGTGPNAVGCLDCHGGHNASDGTNPNYYTLRKTVTMDASQTPDPTDSGVVTIPLDYTTQTPPGQNYNGQCQVCHNNALPAGHDWSWLCEDCHSHAPTEGTGSFAPSCGSCHGFPPTVGLPGNTNPGGYAVDASIPSNYASSTPPYKNEALTPHKAHSAGGTDYAYTCDNCHGANANNGSHVGHKDAAFQQILNLSSGGVAGLPGLPKTGGMSPAYAIAGSGTCSNVYCHSNGGKRTDDGAYTYTPATIPGWDAGAGTISTCNACHDNSGAMAKNSAAHAAHIAKGYTCNLCHRDTASNNTTLAAGASIGKHVNGGPDVVFNTAYPLGGTTLGTGAYVNAGAGTCAVYCHSNGTTMVAPDWDVPASGDCGSCHQVSSGGFPSGSGTALNGVHATHVYATGAVQLACTDCHSNNGTGDDHVNGLPSMVAGSQAVCNACHGAIASVTSGNDREPDWFNTGSVDCMTCHVGALASIGGTPAPDKSQAISTGHSLMTGSYPSGQTSAKQQCEACHSAAAPGHFDGFHGDDSRLVGGYACTTCHDTIVTHHSKQCQDCHNPHGTSNWFMIYASQTEQNGKDTSGTDEFSGDVVFTARSGDNSYDEVDSGPGANLDDICATCHSTTDHNNRTDTGTHFGDSLTHEGENCLTCHNDHANANPFSGNANNCEGCHSALASSGAHAAHINVLPSIDNDLSECAICHEGADQYTVSGSPNGLHRANGVNTAVAIGYVPATGNCTNACHKSSITANRWTDTSLTCDACHYQNANPTLAGNDADVDKLSGDHSAHFGAGSVVTCADCHDVFGAGDTSHITDRTGANQGAILTGMATALQNEAMVTVAALGSGSDLDPGNPTCNNAACHNPSAGANSVTWITTTGKVCTLCHSNSNPNTGSHNAHLNISVQTTFGINTIACTSCHPDHGTNYAHRSGNVTFAAGMNYTAGAVDVLGTMGTCTTTTCHNDGTGAARPTPVWNDSSQPNCGICHLATPGTARHAEHINKPSYVTGCGNCHPAATVSTHIDGTKQNTVSYVSGTQTCTNSCHVANTTGDWTLSGTLACLDCHAGTYIGGNNVAKGFNATPSTGLHTGTLTVSGNTHDDSFNDGNAGTATCVTCHTATPSTAHLNGTYTSSWNAAPPSINFNSNLVFTDGATPTCGPTGVGYVTCHDDGGAWKRKWSDTARNDATPNNECANCHGDFTLATGFVTGVAGRHQTTTSGDPGGQIGTSHDGTDKCYTCHTYKAGDLTYYNIANSPVGQHRDGIIQLNSNMGFTDYGSTVGCTICHAANEGTNDGQHDFEDTTVRWGRVMQNGPATDCNTCHTSNSRTHADASESSSVHDAHTASGYISGPCNDCHLNNGPGGTNHNNNTVDFGGTYMTTAANYSGAAFGGSCAAVGVNGCHDSDAAGEWAANSLGADACADCHAAGTKLLNQGAYPPASNKHTSHLNNNTLVPGDCNDCHGANATTGAHTGHVDTNITLAGQVTPPFNADGTCTNTCHAVVADRDWDNGTLICADCHAATTKSLYTAYALSGYPPVSAKHTPHLNDNNYVPNDCNDCHGANAVTGGHTNHQDGTKQTTVSYVSGTQTCTNSCHLANTTGDWTLPGTLACLDCHAGTYVGGNNVAKGFNATPSTGLHTGTMTVSGNTHDDSFNDGNAGTATCVTCHTAIPSTAHLNGIYTSTWNAAPPSINFNSNLVFTDGATPTCGPTGVGYVTCHDDGGAWKRKWSDTARNDATPNNECANCHGDFGYGFVNGMSARHQTVTTGDPGGQIAANHDGNDKCYYCHAYKPSDTTHYNIANSPVGQHRDGKIQINNGAGFTDNGTTVGCTNCHVANDGTSDGQHAFTEITGTRWTRDLLTGFSVDCNSCHSTNNRVHGDASENLDIHNQHVASGYTVSCMECHPNNGPGTGTNHNNGTVDFGGTYLTAANYSVAAFGGSCAAVGVNGCHDSDGAGEWAAGTLNGNGDACADCHSAGTKLLNQGVYPPTSNKHTIHRDNNVLVPGDCADCHGANADLGTHVGHKDMLKTTTNKVSTYSADGTCTNTCHEVVVDRDWTNGTLICADCHAATTKSLYTSYSLSGYPPVSAKHTPHLGNDILVLGDCNDCHGTGATAGTHTGHQDGTKQTTVSYASGTQTCTNNCHTANTTGDWTIGGALICADCHAASGKNLNQGGFPPVSAKHQKHNDNINYVGSQNCTACHGANAATGTHASHMNGATENTLSYVSGSQTCTNTCHIASTTGDWTLGGALACLDCHSGSYIGGNNVAKGFNATPSTGLHAGTLITSGNTHDDSFNDGVAAGAGTCVTCHTSSPSSSHINGIYANSTPTITIATNVVFNDAVTPPTCGPNATLVACHDDGGAWKRKWSTTAQINDDTRCANCHGDFTTGFVTGMAGRHQTTTSGDADGQIAAYHDGTDKCYTCHSYKAGDTTYYNIANAPTGQHRDGTIQINTNVGFVDNGASVGCSKCHSSNDGIADEQHEFVDTTSRWLRNSTFNGPPISCATCHAYPPVPGDGKVNQAVEGKGAHAKHVAHIAARAGVTLAPLTDTFTGANSAAVCGVCHDVSTGSNHSTAGGTRNLLIPSTYQFGTPNPPTFNGAVGQSSSVNPKSCSSVSCHFKETPVWAPVGGE